MAERPRILLQGRSLSEPPLFNGSNYYYWKNRMRLYMMSQDVELWKVVVQGSKIPTKDVKGLTIPKTLDEWDKNDNKLIQMNAMAMHMLYCALDEKQFILIATCETAKEIWDKLETVYGGGDSLLKQSMLMALRNKYHLFKMLPNESISDMFVRFTDIINGLKALGESYPNSELVVKVLQTLDEATPTARINWETKVTAIEVNKNFDTFNLNELMTSLMAYELRINTRSNQ